MIHLLDLYTAGSIRDGGLDFLYDLMKERDPEINISHSTLPTFWEHRQFVARRPYRCWYLIEAYAVRGWHGTGWVGYISATNRNEIGIVLLRDYRGHGFGAAAIRNLVQLHRPLPAEPSVRVGRWLANIAPANEHSKHVFSKLGFVKKQETYELPEEMQHDHEASQETGQA